MSNPDSHGKDRYVWWAWESPNNDLAITGYKPFGIIKSFDFYTPDLQRTPDKGTSVAGPIDYDDGPMDSKFSGVSNIVDHEFALLIMAALGQQYGVLGAHLGDDPVSRSIVGYKKVGINYILAAMNGSIINKLEWLIDYSAPRQVINLEEKGQYIYASDPNTNLDTLKNISTGFFQGKDLRTEIPGDLLSSSVALSPARTIMYYSKDSDLTTAFTVEYTGSGGKAILKISAARLQTFVDGVLDVDIDLVDPAESANTIALLITKLNGETGYNCFASPTPSALSQYLAPIALGEKIGAPGSGFQAKYIDTTTADRIDKHNCTNIKTTIERSIKPSPGVLTGADGVNVSCMNAGMTPEEYDVSIEAILKEKYTIWDIAYRDADIYYYWLVTNCGAKTPIMSIGPSKLLKPPSPSTQHGLNTVTLNIGTLGGEHKAGIAIPQ